MRPLVLSCVLVSGCALAHERLAVTHEVDAGPDAAFVCPSDVSTLWDTPCAIEQQMCGTCIDPCNGGQCNLVQCQHGTWQREWVGCPVALLFPCGPTLRCAHTQVCAQYTSDVASTPTDWMCNPFPEGCAFDCSCFANTAAESCAQASDGTVTVTYVAR